MGRIKAERVNDWAPLTGHRCLIVSNEQYYYVYPMMVEATVVEVSPKYRVKFQFDDSQNTEWHEKEDYLLVENLGLTGEKGNYEAIRS